ncbi:hypothetical protein L1049_019489 [Liquidambar formosana]|uniref:Tetratricopeptide repeat protein 27 homolog n=1 Tax=Liquidambar formosana TaxID=63359 RepID=A0AAP0SBT7_LIQFO
MAEHQPELLRAYELRLLRCTLPSPPSDSIPTNSSQASNQSNAHRLHALISDIASSIETGNYLQAFSSDAVQLVFKLDDFSSEFYDDSVECADRVYSELMKSVDSFLMNNSDNDEDGSFRAILVMAIAIAAFLAFTQCNLTGPFDGLPQCPLPLKVSKGVEWENWARNQLMSVGSDLLGKLFNLQYLVFAKMLLMRTKDLLFEGSVSSKDGIRSISWWLARVILIQQRILDERSSSLLDLSQVFMGETLNHFGTMENVTNYWGDKLHEEEALAIVAMLHLEAGIMEHTYGRVDSCRRYFESAEVASGLQLSVTGVLGFRTVHQVTPKAQLVLVANASTSNGGDTLPSISPELETNVSSTGENNSCLHQCETCEASDILMAPRLLEDDNDSRIGGQDVQSGSAPSVSFKEIQQAVILAQCLLIEKSTRHDEMQRWEMAPYIEAIDSQQSSYFIIRCFCDILRIRWESTRSHTKERALLMMDKLKYTGEASSPYVIYNKLSAIIKQTLMPNMVQGICEHSPGVAQRIHSCYGVSIPTISALRKEYGELLVSSGLVGEAVKIFEDLELWDNLIYCYCLLEKKAAAVELINTRLSETPSDPRLWCSLGDITHNDSCYEKALEVSNSRSARAKRSLARSAYNRGDFEASKILWESAMALNSLYPDGWFALGAAALKARDVEKALDGFTRAVQLDPENGEAWNNIACLHMIKKRSKEAFIAFKEALKFKRNSWQLWENFSQVAADVGNFGQALQAIQMVLDMTSNKRIDAELLERMILEMEGRASASQFACPVAPNDDNFANQTHLADSANESTYSDFGVSSSRETGHLMELLGKILQKIVRSGGGGDIWGLYARWHKIKGDLTMCSEALLKQVRSYQGSELWKDRDRFKKFARASLELCKVYMEISSSTGSRRELLTAEMHLRNTIKQGDSFSDMEEFRDLQASLDEVKMNLQSTTLASS